MNRWLVSCCLIALAIMATLTFISLEGCHLAPTDEEMGNSEQGGGLPGDVGGSVAIWHMPFPAGTAWRCTQGAGGTYSHSYTSTRWDLDLDGSLFSVVASRELAGCTGACSGDHVHIGVHSGDAAQRAGLGTSIPSAMFAADRSVSGAAQAYPTEDVTCGLSAGHFYESQLPVWEEGDVEDDPIESGDDDAAGDDDDTVPSDDDDNESGDDDADDDDDATPPPETGRTLCWWPTGLINPHNGELWVKVDGVWQTVDSASGPFAELCGSVNAETGDVLTVNGEFSASNALSDPWWICSNWGEAGGMVVHGEFTVDGAPPIATDTPNGVGGCDVHVVVP